METTPPVHERRWRTLAAAVAAPATLVGLQLLSSAGYLATPEHVAKYFPTMFVWWVAVICVGSALVGGLASALRVWLKAPLRAGVVVSLCALSAAPLGLIVPTDWSYRALFAVFTAVISLPASLTYCAIAGIRWR